MAALLAVVETPVNEAIEFRWNTGRESYYGIRPEVAASEVRRIYESEGVITTDALVAESADQDAPLHRYFQWDNTEAARMWRLEQAQALIRNLVVVYRKADGEPAAPTRYVVKLLPSATDDPGDEVRAAQTAPHAYLPIRTVMSDAELRERYVAQAFKELCVWRDRYADIEAFARLFKTIDKLREERA